MYKIVADWFLDTGNPKALIIADKFGNQTLVKKLDTYPEGRFRLLAILD